MIYVIDTTTRRITWRKVLQANCCLVAEDVVEIVQQVTGDDYVFAHSTDFREELNASNFLMRASVDESFPAAQAHQAILRIAKLRHRLVDLAAHGTAAQLVIYSGDPLVPEDIREIKNAVAQYSVPGQPDTKIDCVKDPLTRDCTEERINEIIKAFVKQASKAAEDPSSEIDGNRAIELQRFANDVLWSLRLLCDAWEFHQAKEGMAGDRKDNRPGEMTIYSPQSDPSKWFAPFELAPTIANAERIANLLGDLKDRTLALLIAVLRNDDLKMPVAAFLRCKP